MKKKLRFRLILILIFCNCYYSNSQGISNKLETSKSNVSFPTNPSVYEFSKYGDVNINEYRGLADINIPLYQISLDGINIGLNLNYYTGGIKVSEEAGLVGLGWNMSLPTLIQNIKDEDDLDPFTKFQTLPGNTGNTIFPTAGGLNPDYWSPSYFTFGGADVATPCSNAGSVAYNIQPQYFVSSGYFLINKDGKYPCGSEFYDMCYTNVDTEPDTFTVNINGDNLIIIRDDIGVNTPSPINNVSLPLKVINGHSEYKVELLNDGGIKIIDFSGSQYFFNLINSINSIFTNNGYLQNGSLSNQVTSKIFKLTKIITNKNNEIIFSYFNGTVKDLEKHSYIYYKNINTTSQTLQSNYYNSNPENIEGVNLPTFNSSQQSSYTVTSEKQSQLFSFLTTISTPNEVVSFNYSDRIDYEGMKKIDNIQIANNNNVIKSIDFNYSYFSNGTGYLNNRLKLESVSTNNENSYSFIYNEGDLPSKNSYSIDYWGYFNGKPNISFFPNLNDLGYSNYNDNSQNDFKSYLTFCKIASLQKIIYPTGGYSEFEYELNEFDDLILHPNMNNYVPIITKGGGLRIKSISDFSALNSLSSKKQYNYYNGKVIFKKRLVREITGVKSIISSGINTPIPNLTKYNTNLIEANLSNGNLGKNFIDEIDDYIGYDKVEITKIGGSYNGKILKEFTNTAYNILFPFQKLNFKPTFYKDRNYLSNGTLLNEKIFNNSNEVIKEKKYIYSLLTSNINRYGVSFSAYDTTYFFQFNSNGSQEFIHPRFLLTSYPIFANTPRLLKVIDSDVFSSGTKLTTTEYQYNSNNIPIGKTLKNQSGEIIYQENSSMSTNSVVLSKNILDLPIWLSVSENGSVKKFLQYIYSTDNNVVLPIKTEELPEGNPDPSTKINFFYDLYDDKNNVLQYHQEHNINVSIIWGYNKTLPVAKIENVAYSSISSSLIQAIQEASNTGTEAQLLIALENLRNALPDAMVTTYTHKPLVGVCTMVDAKGNKFTYHYDTNNRLQFVKDKNGNVLSENEYHYKD
ncbi:hypothetical protein GOQ30_07590 [Flavobacterium sp. TP390]|uniref:YD repeat-containing protein n=1 Tax=Flavobacterium profundi TaxID=1774945 RepID=A0A6I4IHI0_9FLAO|nr:hypothetical protein [Flavobacterium profundi]MVO09028.1 hypothetical protein [Flavobacterium profundi]